MECPELKKIQAGDEAYYWCNLSDHPCMREYDNVECEVYNDFMEEMNEEVSAKGENNEGLFINITNQYVFTMSYAISVPLY